MTIGSLFSGVGGLELGLEWAGLGPVVWQVEKDPFCRSVLAKHWPDVERFEDVEEAGSANLAPVDLICGGFPCQDISSAGKGAGLDGSRSGLWSEYARILRELRPQWAVIENVASGANRWVDAVVRQLGWLGYETLPAPLTAWAVGASHPRERIFLLARRYSTGTGETNIRTDAHRIGRDEGVLPRRATTPKGERARPANDRDFPWGFESNLVRAVHGIPNRVDRVRSLGNAVVPQCAEVIGNVILELTG